MVGAGLAPALAVNVSCTANVMVRGLSPPWAVNVSYTANVMVRGACPALALVAQSTQPAMPISGVKNGNRNETAHPHSTQGIRPSYPRPVGYADCKYCATNRCSRLWTSTFTDRDRQIYGDAITLC